MLPTEQSKFFDAISAALADYVKEPSKFELESWWAGCKGFALHDVQRALRAHQADEDDSKRPPRPIDVKRRLSTGAKDSKRCAASDPTGQCEYPGIFSDGTQGEGPWYCPWHRVERSGPEASTWIERSRNIPYQIASERRVERMGAEAQRAPSVVSTAHGMAMRGRPSRGNAGDLARTALNLDAEDVA